MDLLRLEAGYRALGTTCEVIYTDEAGLAIAYRWQRAEATGRGRACAIVRSEIHCAA